MPWQIVLGMATCAVVVGLCLWRAYELGYEDGSRKGSTEGATGLPPGPGAGAQDPETLPGLEPHREADVDVRQAAPDELSAPDSRTQASSS